MEYKKQIDPELRRIARKVPYNKVVIMCANLFQAVSFGLTTVPKGVTNGSITIGRYINML